MNLRKRLAVDPAAIEVLVSDTGTRDTPGVKNRKRAARDLFRIAPRLADLQEELYAEGKSGGKRRLIVLLQGMDASGKDGTIKHVMSGVNPQGCQVHSFKAPSGEELDHDFLWRCAQALPERPALVQLPQDRRAIRAEQRPAIAPGGPAPAVRPAFVRAAQQPGAGVSARPDGVP